jgi:hypothetical protein
MLPYGFVSPLIAFIFQQPKEPEENHEWSKKKPIESPGSILQIDCVQRFTKPPEGKNSRANNYYFAYL